MANGAGRRDPRSFEPPPWEREQFEELEKSRAVQPTEPAEAAPEQPVPIAPEPAPESVAAPEPTIEAAGPEPVAKQEGPGGVTEAAMLEMMARLAAEEPPAVRGVWQLALVASAVLGSIGLMMFVFGVVGMTKAAKAGWTAMFGGGVLLVFGLAMLGLAGWMTYKTLRQRGVL